METYQYGQSSCQSEPRHGGQTEHQDRAAWCCKTWSGMKDMDQQRWITSKISELWINSRYLRSYKTINKHVRIKSQIWPFLHMTCESATIRVLKEPLYIWSCFLCSNINKANVPDTAGGTNLDMQCSDTQLLATLRNILRGKHSSVGGRLHVHGKPGAARGFVRKRG